MTDVQAPDGTIARFPDGMSDDAITAVMRRQFPPSQPAADATPVQAGNLQSGASQSQDPGILANVVRAMTAGANPFQDRMVAAEKTVLPQALGGSPGFGGYAENLEQQRAANAQLREQHPAISNIGQGTGAALASLAVPAAALGPLARGTGTLGRVALGSATGAGLGAVQGVGAAPDLTNAGQTFGSGIGGATGGAALGAAFPAGGAAIGKIVSPFRIDPARQALVDALTQSGIKPTAGQATGSKGLQKIEAAISDIPFAGGGAETAREANNKAFTAAVMDKSGLPGVTDATPATLNAAHKALGAQFDALGARNSIAQDPKLGIDLDTALQGYHDVTPVPMRAPGIEKIVNDIKNPAATESAAEIPTAILTRVESQPNTPAQSPKDRITAAPAGQPEARDVQPSSSVDISGDKYNNLRSQLGKTAQRLKITDPAQAEAYRGVQGALDDAMERSIGARAQSGDQQAALDLGAFQDVRGKYKNLLSVEQAAGSAGADAAMGQISPAQMRTALASGNNRKSYARGIGDLAPLTNAANAILTSFPQSGTTPRALMAHALQAAGGLTGFASGGLEGAGIGSIVAPALAGRMIMSKPVQAYLANGLASRIGPSAAKTLNRAALAATLAGNQNLQTQRRQSSLQ